MRNRGVPTFTGGTAGSSSRAILLPCGHVKRIHKGNGLHVSVVFMNDIGWDRVRVHRDGRLQKLKLKSICSPLFRAQTSPLATVGRS